MSETGLDSGIRRMNDRSPRRSKHEIVATALRRHRRVLRAFVGSRVPPSSVDDLLQSAAVRAIEKADSLQDPTKVLPWLYRIHRNLIIDGARSQAARQRTLRKIVDSESTHYAFEAPETCACSVSLAQTLPPNYADVLRLIDMGDTSITEAASQLGITANNVMVRLHRARKALKHTMMEHCGVRSARECFDCRCAHEGCCPA